jgi:hypothetical protein
MTIAWAAAALAIYGCGSSGSSTGHGLHDGVYRNRATGGKVYAQVTPAELTLYPLSSAKPAVADTTKPAVYANEAGAGPLAPKLSKTSMDLDASTAIFKYRFAAGDVPNQLSASLNANLYVGYRKDFFSFTSRKTPTGHTNVKLHHREFDMGVFAGFGITPVNPTVTSGQVSQEYDGMVFQKGVALFGGWGNMTLGLGLGFDTLLDNNHQYWIYHEKPWLGLFIGIAISE